MELKDKLEVFYQSVIEVARERNEKSLEHYKEEYAQNKKDFIKNKQSEMDALFHIEELRLTKELNRRVTSEMIEYKQKLRVSQSSLKEDLFLKIECKIRDFLATGEYEQYLVKKLEKAKAFAKENEIIFYLNQSDQHLKEKLEQQTNCHLTISNVDFIGGIRGVIRSKNILIDESFSSKLNQEKKDYVFSLE